MTANMTMTYDITYTQLTKRGKIYLLGFQYHRYRVVYFKQPSSEVNIHYFQTLSLRLTEERVKLRAHHVHR